MAIQVSGTTVIDDSRNIVNANNVNVGVVTMTGSTGAIETPGTITAAGFTATTKPAPILFVPTNGATNQEFDLDTFVITFNQVITAQSGKNVTFREGSATGTVLETLSVTGSNVTVTNGSTVTITASTFWAASATIYVVIDDGAFQNDGGLGNEIINTYNFTVSSLSEGDFYEGGYLICQSGGTKWVVAPLNAVTTATWWARNNAVTCANSVAACGDWFVPSLSQFQNPGYACKTYWDGGNTYTYWTNTGPYFNMNDGTYGQTDGSVPAGFPGTCQYTRGLSVRAFRTTT